MLRDRRNVVGVFDRGRWQASIDSRDFDLSNLLQFLAKLIRFGVPTSWRLECGKVGIATGAREFGNWRPQEVRIKPSAC